jgi:hypothetical protein
LSAGQSHAVPAEETIVTMRTRKLVGTVVLLIFIIIYSLLAMMAAIVLQVNANKFTEVVYYIVAGLAWLPPAAWIIWWMQRPDQPRFKG